MKLVESHPKEFQWCGTYLPSRGCLFHANNITYFQENQKLKTGLLIFRSEIRSACVRLETVGVCWRDVFENQKPPLALCSSYTLTIFIPRVSHAILGFCWRGFVKTRCRRRGCCFFTLPLPMIIPRVSQDTLGVCRRCVITRYHRRGCCSFALTLTIMIIPCVSQETPRILLKKMCDN